MVVLEKLGMNGQNALPARHDHFKGVWGKCNGAQRGCRGQRPPAAGAGRQRLLSPLISEWPCEAEPGHERAERPPGQA
jgi:hypothetical protein